MVEMSIKNWKVSNESLHKLLKGFIPYKRYSNKETIVREQIRPTSDGASDVNVPFINFIVCPSYDSAYKGEVLRKYGLTIHDYRSTG